MSEGLSKKVEECSFDKSDGCHALACYSDKNCNSRDENGKPIYVDTEIIKKEIKIKEYK